VPIPLPDGGLVLTTYRETSRTYDWRRFDASGEEQWLAVHPAGGYASPALSADASHVVGPVGGTAWLALDVRDGRELWRLPHHGFIRSSPVPVGDVWVAASGGSLLTFAHGSLIDQRAVPSHVFYGRAVVAGGLVVSLAVRRRGDATDSVAIAFNPSSLDISWEQTVGRDLLIACDTAGPAVDAERDRVLVTAPDGVVQALSALDGRIAWRTQLTGDSGRPLTVSRSAPSSQPDGIAVGSLEGYVAVVEPADGRLRWIRRVEPFGVWSPPLWLDSLLVVHSGSLLVGLDPQTGDRRWSIPIGFDGYTAPTRQGEHIALCGGDPPLDGYLVWIDPNEIAHHPDVRTIFQHGDDRDALWLRVTPKSAAARIEMDLRALGASANERLVPDGGGSFTWYGLTPPSKRNAEVVVFGSVLHGTTHQPFSALINTGAARRPAVPSARTLEADELPLPQADPTASGPAVVTALARAHGRYMDTDAVRSAALYLKQRGDVPAAHVWRGGAARMFMASQFPFFEQRGDCPNADNVREVLRDWQDADGRD
jgi:outer membrane protein assembly factor BamB